VAETVQVVAACERKTTATPKSTAIAITLSTSGDLKLKPFVTNVLELFEVLFFLELPFLGRALGMLVDLFCRIASSISGIAGFVYTPMVQCGYGGLGHSYMVRSVSSIRIQRPVDAVYAFLMRPENYLLWMSGLISLRASDGLSEGSTLTFTSVGAGKKIEMVAVVTANNGRDEFAVDSVQGPMSFASVYRLERADGDTHLQLTNRIETNLVFRLAEPVLQAMSDNKYRSDLAGLKAILESEPTN